MKAILDECIGLARILGALIFCATPVGAANVSWDWIHLLAGPYEDAITGVAVTPNGMVYFSGHSYGGRVGPADLVGANMFVGSYNSTGGVAELKVWPLDSTGFASSALTVTAEGGLLVSGTYSGSISLGNDRFATNAGSFLTKLTGNLDAIWARSVGDIVVGVPAFAAAQTTNGRVVLATGFRRSMLSESAQVAQASQQDVGFLRFSPGGSWRVLGK